MILKSYVDEYICYIAFSAAILHRIGTRATISPCHWDSYENLFVQVCGYKYMMLFTENNSKYMYPTKDSWLKQKKWPQMNPSSNGMKDQADDVDVKTSPTSHEGMGTISEVDVADPDYERHPDFRNAKGYEVLLAPGDLLYIPSKCWHYVRAETTSISLNFLF